MIRMKTSVSFNDLSEMDKNHYLGKLLNNNLLNEALNYFKNSNKFLCDADIMFSDKKSKPLLVEFCKKHGVNGKVKFMKNNKEVCEPILNFTSLYENLECLTMFLLVSGASKKS